VYRGENKAANHKQILLYYSFYKRGRLSYYTQPCQRKSAVQAKQNLQILRIYSESNSPHLGPLTYDTQPWTREKAVQAQNHTYDESKDKYTLLPLLHEKLKLKLKHANKHLLFFTTFRSFVDPLFFFFLIAGEYGSIPLQLKERKWVQLKREAYLEERRDIE
jgi:hypothetical protein